MIDRGPFVRANWPWLSLGAAGFLGWFLYSGDPYAAAAGVFMAIWILWHTVIRRGR